MQNDLFAADPLECRQLLPCDGEAWLYPQWLDADSCRHYFDLLEQQLTWQQSTVSVYGKEHLIPRLNAWHGDSDSLYGYSGLSLTPEPWITPLAELRQRLQQQEMGCFNSVLANYYRDGKDGVGWHSDDESELGPQPLIASISLGAVRRFAFKHRRDKSIAPISLDLPSGSLLIMKGLSQVCWQHQLAKTAKPVAGRINLTFRFVSSSYI